jgi:hypothetical protein
MSCYDSRITDVLYATETPRSSELTSQSIMITHPWRYVGFYVLTATTSLLAAIAIAIYCGA